MVGPRDIISAVHATVVWLMMFVFCGPLGLGAGTAVASSSACPCDEDEHAEDEHAEDDDCDDDDDECPDDCSGCGCGPGVAVAMVASTMSTTLSPSSPDLQLAPPDAAATGVRTGVFRPPRALA